MAREERNNMNFKKLLFGLALVHTAFGASVLPGDGIIAQLVDGGEWKTLITLYRRRLS
jgi:hypothetical protein